MSNEQRKVIFTKQDEIDAARLLAVLEQRSKSKRLAGASGRPAEIHDPAVKLEKAADSENDWGLSSFDRCPPVAAAEGENGRGFEKRGQVVVVSRKCWPAEDNTGRSTACPHHDADTIDSLFSVPVLNGNAHRKCGE